MTNRPPVLELIPNQPIRIDGANQNPPQATAFAIQASDPDGDGLTFTQVGKPDYCTFEPSGNTVIMNCLHDASVDAVQDVTVTVTVTDNGLPAESDSQSFDLVMATELNEPPILAIIGNQSVNENEQLVIVLSASDSPANTLTFSVSGLPPFCELQDVGNGSGSLNCNPLPGDQGLYQVVVTVFDDGTPWIPGSNTGSLSDSELFTLTVNPATNNPPVLQPIGLQLVDAEASLQIDLSASDPDLDLLTLSTGPLPAFCEPIVDNGDGTGRIDCLPLVGDVGQYSITVTVTDNGTPVFEDSETFDLVVGPPNLVPTARAGSNQAVINGQLATLDGSASSDTDGVLVSFGWQVTSKPPGSAITTASLSDASAATTSFTPDRDGVYEFRLTVIDDDGAVDTDAVAVTAFTPLRPMRLSLANNQLHADDASGTGFSKTVTIDGGTITAGRALAATPDGLEVYGAFTLSGQFGDELVKLDPLTGTTRRIGNLGEPVSSLAFDEYGTLYATSADTASQPNTLYQVNTATAAMTLRFALSDAGGGPSAGDVIAFNPEDGLLYRATGVGSPGVYPAFEAIDLVSGTATAIPMIGGSRADFEITALVYDPPTGQFFGIRRNQTGGHQSFSLSPGGFIDNEALSLPRRGLADLELEPVFRRVTGVGDLNANGSNEVMVAVADGRRLHVRDGSSDALVADIPIGAGSPLDIAVLPDLDASGSPEVAVLNARQDGQVLVQIRDASSGSLVRNLFFGANYAPTAMRVIDDYSGNGLPEIAVMASDVTDAIRVQVQDAATGTFLDNVFLGSQGVGKDFVAVSDTSGNSVPELGILSVLKDNDQVRTQLWDAMDSTFQTNVWFGSVYQPQSMITMPDINGNGSDEIVAIGVDPATQIIRVQARDSVSAATHYNIWIGGHRAVDIALINDVSGDGFPDLAVLLEQKNGGIVAGRGRVRVQDGITGAFYDNLFFSEVSNPTGMTVIPDYSGNGFDELAVVGESAGVRHVQILDTRSGSHVNRIDFP